MPGKLLWSSTFDTINNLNRDWNIETSPPGRVNSELQSYNYDKVNCLNNELIISTTNDKYNIQSGRVNSKNKIEVKFGYIEALIKFSPALGLWPAFWMLGNNGQNWPNCGEIDIMEWVGWNPQSIFGTLHGPGYNGGNAYGSGQKNLLGKNLGNEYYKFAIEWKPNEIKWFLNDIHYFTATPSELARLKNNSQWVYNDRPFYFIINNAVGGNFGGAYSGYSRYNLLNSLPNYNNLTVQYIRVYQTDDGFGSINQRIQLCHCLPDLLTFPKNYIWEADLNNINCIINEWNLNNLENIFLEEEKLKLKYINEIESKFIVNHYGFIELYFYFTNIGNNVISIYLKDNDNYKIDIFNWSYEDNSKIKNYFKNLKIIDEDLKHNLSNNYIKISIELFEDKIKWYLNNKVLGFFEKTQVNKFYKFNIKINSDNEEDYLLFDYIKFFKNQEDQGNILF